MEGTRAERRGWGALALWGLEEIGLLLGVVLPWLLVAAAGFTRTGLLGLHLALLAYAAFRERERLSGWLRVGGRDLLLGIAGGGAILLAGGGYGLLLEATGVEVPDLATDLRALVPSLSLLVLWGAVVVPVAEEIFFRGRLLDAIDLRVGTGAGLVLSSSAFTVVHGIPVLFPAYFLFGVVFVLLRRRTGRLVAPIVAHAANNLVGILIAG